jgi:hypothetical protein
VPTSSLRSFFDIANNDKSKSKIQETKEQEGGVSFSQWTWEECAHLMFAPSFFQGSLQHEAEMAQKTTEMAIQTPMLMKLDPTWGYFCISDHNLILNSYTEIHVVENRQKGRKCVPARQKGHRSRDNRGGDRVNTSIICCNNT